MHRSAVDHVGYLTKYRQYYTHLPTDIWFACEYPERPMDGNTVYVPACDQCVMHAEVAVRSHGYGLNQFNDDTLIEWLRQAKEEREKADYG